MGTRTQAQDRSMHAAHRPKESENEERTTTMGRKRKEGRRISEGMVSEVQGAEARKDRKANPEKGRGEEEWESSMREARGLGIHTSREMNREEPPMEGGSVQPPREVERCEPPREVERWEHPGEVEDCSRLGRWKVGSLPKDGSLQERWKRGASKGGGER